MMSSTPLYRFKIPLGATYSTLGRKNTKSSQCQTTKTKSMTRLLAIKSFNEKLKNITKTDAFGGFLIDFTALQSDDKFPYSSIFAKILLKEIEKQKLNGIHVMGVKIPADNSKIMKIAIDCGFRHHHGNSEYSLLNRCLKGHQVKECSFPHYRTVSAGVTGVVFNSDLTEVLVVLEQTGPIKKFKPPTGGIDYGISGDTPLKAVVRELKEETQIEVDPNKAILVGTAWSNNYRGINPDISYIFAFVLDKKQEVIAQESEIAKIKWISVPEFLEKPLEEKGKPWLLRQAVEAGLQAVIHSRGMKMQPSHLSTGNPVDFFSVLNRE